MDTSNSHDSTIYEQDCEFYRYQDKLMWSRFQTAALVEGVVLYGLYQLCLPCAEKILLLGTGTILLMIIFVLGMKDGVDANRHLDRIRIFEKNSLPQSKLTCGFGFWSMFAAMIVLIAANVILILLNVVPNLCW